MATIRETTERSASPARAGPASGHAATRGAPHPEPAAVSVPQGSGLVRSRLLDRLDRIQDARIGVVTAMAGSGKTTALAQWARRTGVDVAWWRASAGVPTVDGAVSGLGAAIHAVSPGRHCPSDAVGLIAALSQYDGPLAIVIDDAHHVVTAEVAGFLEELLLNTRVHVVVASREPLPVNLARSELPSLVLGSHELRFRTHETAALLENVHGLTLTEADARRLTRHTGGWPAALELFHQSIADDSDAARHRAITDLPGRSEYAAQYVATQVFAGLDERDLDLLIRTAPLERLSGRACDDLLGSEGSEERLRALHRRGLLDGSDDDLVLDPVIRSRALAALRADLGADGLRCIRSDCGRRLEHDGHAAAAVRAHLAAGDPTAALGVLSRHGTAVVADPDLGWVDELLDHGNDWPRICRATRLLRDGRLAEAGATLGDAAANGTGEVEQHLTALRRFVQVWTGEVAPGPDPWFERLRALLGTSQRVTNVDQESPTLPGDRLAAAVGLAVTGNVTVALRLLDHTPTDGGWLSLAIRTCRAGLRGDTALATEVAEDAEALGIPWFARIATGVVGVRPDADPVAAADARGDRWGALLLAGIMAVRALHDGRPDPAAFDALATRCRALDVPALEAWARCGVALASVATHAPEAARDAESAIGFAHSAQLPAAAALGWAALATLNDQPDRLREAAAEVELAGLGHRPWEWNAASEPGPGRATTIERTAALQVRCFGGFALRMYGADADLRSVRPRSRAVLRMLAIHAGRPVHREQLIAAMWPRLAPDAATHNLHVAISSLRTALEPESPRGRHRLLVRDGDRYTLMLPDNSTADVREFDDETAAARRSRCSGDVEAAIRHLQAATAHYRGEVLPEDGPAEWVLPAREHYQVRAAEAGAMLAELLLGLDRADQAAAAALRSVEADPCRDGSWRLLIAAYDAAGDLASAQHARRSYADVLTSLGVVESATLAVHGGSR